MAAITSTNVASAIVKLVAADALPVLVGNLVMGNLVNRDYEPVLANAGDTVNVPIPPTMVANNILEGDAVQTQNPSLGNAQIVLNTHVEATFQIPDVTKVLAVPDLLKIYMQPSVAAIAQRIETDLLSLYAGFTTNPPVGTAATPITEAVIDAAETALFLAKVPPQEQKFIVVDAATYSAWRQIPRFSEFQNAGEAGLRALIEGTIGKIKDFFVFRSQLAAIRQSALSKQLDFNTTQEVLRAYGDTVKDTMKQVLWAIAAARQDGVSIDVSGLDEFDIEDFGSGAGRRQETAGSGNRVGDPEEAGLQEAGLQVPVRRAAGDQEPGGGGDRPDEVHRGRFLGGIWKTSTFRRSCGRRSRSSRATSSPRASRPTRRNWRRSASGGSNWSAG